MTNAVQVAVVAAVAVAAVVVLAAYVAFVASVASAVEITEAAFGVAVAVVGMVAAIDEFGADETVVVVDWISVGVAWTVVAVEVVAAAVARLFAYFSVPVKGRTLSCT